MSMENDMYIAPPDMACRSSSVIDEIMRHPMPKPLIHCYSFERNSENYVINGIPMLFGEQNEPSSYVHRDGHFINPASIADSNSFVTSQVKIIVGDASNPIDNRAFPQHFASLAARIGLQENLENSVAMSHSLCSLDALGPYISNNWLDTSNPLSATFGNCGYDEVPGYEKLNVNKFLKPPEVDGTGFHLYSSIGNLDPNGWTSSNVANLTSHAYNSSNFSNELSSSLATSPTIGSEMSCSDGQASCSSRELSKNLVSNRHVQFSPAIPRSRYLAGIQEILAQIAAYSFENLEQINYSAAGVAAGGNKSTSAFTPKTRIVINNHNKNAMFEGQADSPLHRHAAESNKSQLLTLLQLVDDRYSECLDEIHTVVSAFHAVTELNPNIHAHFALQTISHLYKDLRKRISDHITAMGLDFNNSCSEEKEWSDETSFIQKQWALRQLKSKDQLWRPQRGLPETSVSVLRAWMFQNFLHPYPKDAEKHLLAVQSGLTRSQVSNWFINARVRLWKPMIEEMYAEMDRRKAYRNEEEMESGRRSHTSMMNNQRFNTN